MPALGTAPVHFGELRSAVHDAAEQLDALERTLRRRLGVLYPADPAAEADLPRLRLRLAEAAARREVDSWSEGQLADGTPHLEFHITPAHRLAAVLDFFGGGVFAVIVAAVAASVVPGLLRSGDPLSIVFVACWSVGFSLASIAQIAGGISLGRSEAVRFEGPEVTIRRRLLGFTSTRRSTLALPAHAGRAAAWLQHLGAWFTDHGRNWTGAPKSPKMEVVIVDGTGREVRFGYGRPDFDQQRMVDRINDYLRALC